MKRYVIDGTFTIDGLRQEETDVPRPGYGQALVRIRAVSLNYRDLLMVNGNYSRNLKLPLVPLSDGAGEVVEVGEGVTRWKAGDRVVPTFFQDWPAGRLTAEVAALALSRSISPSRRGPRSPALGWRLGTVCRAAGSPAATLCWCWGAAAYRPSPSSLRGRPGRG